jgi:hypothetical protein
MRFRALRLTLNDLVSGRDNRHRFQSRASPDLGRMPEDRQAIIPLLAAVDAGYVFRNPNLWRDEFGTGADRHLQ